VLLPAFFPLQHIEEIGGNYGRYVAICEVFGISGDDVVPVNRSNLDRLKQFPDSVICFIFVLKFLARDVENIGSRPSRTSKTTFVSINTFILGKPFRSVVVKRSAAVRHNADKRLRD
jgi:hypothetical protein